MRLFDSAFSPFARNVRMVLEYKELEFESIDGLSRAHHATLRAVNPRLEVPTLLDGATTVVNSADIIHYVEHRYPNRPVYPVAPEVRVHALAWERAADTYLDAILVDISYWKWAERPDEMPPGLLEAARVDLAVVYLALERELAQRAFVSGALSIADFALFPHLASARALDVDFEPSRYPQLTRWFKQMRALPVCAADLARARDYLGNIRAHDVERDKIFWRGDRIEWLLARGFHNWFAGEVAQGRVLWPGPSLPAPLVPQ